MSMLSVLDEEDGGANELMRCKLNYLQAENAWMTQEYDSLCKLVELQKQIIHAQPDSLPEINNSIAQVLAIREQQLSEAQRRTETPVEMEMEPQEFIPLIYSFEEKIDKLQQEIKNREKALQEIEEARSNEPDGKTPEFKCIATYDSQARLLDRIKKEIATQQARKQKLENELLAMNEKGDQESTVASQAQSRTKPQEEQASAFERVIMLLKKKRYQNNCLEEKVKRIRTALEHKRVASNRLRAEIEGMEWNCLDGLVGAGSFVDAEKGDLSLAGRSFNANNASFSFDVSRFIRPKQPLRLE